MSITKTFETLTQEKESLIKSIECLGECVATTIIKSHIEELNKKIDEIKNKNKNYLDFIDHLFSENETQIQTYQEHIIRNTLIVGPCQLGKTQSIINVVKDSITRGYSIVISSDNKKDQMMQMFKRLTKEVSLNYETIFKNCFVSTADNKNFKNFSDNMNSNTTFVICCLDNATQIQKVYEKINALSTNLVKGIVVIHDESDVINKARNVTEIRKNEPASHRKWIETLNNLKTKFPIKRVFVSATPENNIYLQKPSYVMEIPIVPGYVSSSDIHFHETDDYTPKAITKIIKREVNLRKETGGIILYSVERNKEESDDFEDSQGTVYAGLVNSMQSTKLDVVSSYNGDGFKVSFRLKKHETLFFNKLEEKDFSYDHYYEENYYLINKNSLAICEFYRLLQDSGCKVVLTIGKDLLSRGISFVSNKQENPLTAVSMIYKPGNTLSQVQICQAIGRLCGTAQSDLPRRLYTTDNVYTNYTTFCSNQREILKAIRENGKCVTDDLIADIALWKGTRSVDRKALKLEQDMKFWEDTVSESGYSSDSSDRMKTLIDRWWDAETIIGKILGFVYKNKKVNETELLEFLDTNNYSNAWYYDLIKSKYTLIFSRKNNVTTLTNSAKKYIKTLI